MAGDLGGTASEPTVPALTNKVDKETGKGLSTNDYTTTEKNKLAAITGTNTGDQDISGLATTAALALKANIASPTFTGLVITPTPTATSAGIRLPHGIAPTTTENGDIWTTTSGLFANINSAVKQFPTLSDGNNFTGNNTFSGTTLIFGNNADASTVNIGIGANAADIQKTVNIATNGAVGSTTTVRMGPIAGKSSMTFGQSTADSDIQIGTGATVDHSFKTLNIGTGGLTGSTTTLRMGPINGESTMTFGQSTADSDIQIGTGATVDHSFKTLNIGTGGLTGSTTTLRMGPINGESTMTFGQSTANSTFNIGTGATVSGSTKAVNIATNGATDSTTNVNIGPTAGLGAVTLGQSTVASTVNIGTGATVSGSIKTVNIGTGGVAGSTTNTTIGTTSGGASNVTINGPTTIGNTATFTGANIFYTGTNINIGNAAAAGFYGIGTGALNAGTKTINIGTGGVSGSTTNTTIGTNNGGASNVTINGLTTHTGLTITPASTTTTAGLRLPHGAQPTTPVNGDMWTQTNGLFAWISGGVKQFGNLQDGLIYSGNNTFAGPNLVFGNTTAASTVDIGTGATAASTTKAINIGTNGVATSTTNVTIGSANGGTTTRINGSVQHTYTSTATALTLTAAHRYVVVTAAVVITLPAAASFSGTVYTINARIAGVTTSLFKNLSGADTTGITSGTSITIISDGTNWQQVN